MQIIIDVNLVSGTVLHTISSFPLVKHRHLLRFLVPHLRNSSSQSNDATTHFASYILNMTMQLLYEVLQPQS